MIHTCVCREADESRLREVCESFLGPPTGMASDSKNPAWDPYVLVSFSSQPLIVCIPSLFIFSFRIIKEFFMSVLRFMKTLSGLVAAPPNNTISRVRTWVLSMEVLCFLPLHLTFLETLSIYFTAFFFINSRNEDHFSENISRAIFHNFFCSISLEFFVEGWLLTSSQGITVLSTSILVVLISGKQNQRGFWCVPVLTAYYFWTRQSLYSCHVHIFSRVILVSCTQIVSKVFRCKLFSPPWIPSIWHHSWMLLLYQGLWNIFNVSFLLTYLDVCREWESTNF